MNSRTELCHLLLPWNRSIRKTERPKIGEHIIWSTQSSGRAKLRWSSGFWNHGLDSTTNIIVVNMWLSALKKIWTKYHLLCATMISEFDCLTTIRTPIRCFVPKDNEPIAHLIQRTMSHLFRSLHEKELPTKSAKYCSCPISGAHCFKALPQF